VIVENIDGFPEVPLAVTGKVPPAPPAPIVIGKDDPTDKEIFVPPGNDVL
jgi:hypothetical protein